MPPSHGTAVAQPHHRGVPGHPAGTAGGCLAVPGRAQPPEPLSQCSHHLPSWLPVPISCGSRAWDQSPAEAWILVPSCCCSKLSAGRNCSDWTFPLIFFPIPAVLQAWGNVWILTAKSGCLSQDSRGQEPLCSAQCPSLSLQLLPQSPSSFWSGVLMKNFINSWTQTSESSFPT